jgi:hypothetical protein
MKRADAIQSFVNPPFRMALTFFDFLIFARAQ